MAEFHSATISNGQSVSADTVLLKSAHLSAGASNAAVATIYGTVNGSAVALLRLSAVAGGSDGWSYPGPLAANKPFPGPVTVDISGTGAFLNLDY